MSSDEKTEHESEGKDEDVVTHRYVTEEPGDDDPERRKKKMSDDPEGTVDPEGDEFGRRKK